MQVKAAETIGSVMGKELGATLLFLCIFRSVWYTAVKKPTGRDPPCVLRNAVRPF